MSRAYKTAHNVRDGNYSLEFCPFVALRNHKARNSLKLGHLVKIRFRTS